MLEVTTVTGIQPQQKLASTEKVSSFEDAMKLQFETDIVETAKYFMVNWHKTGFTQMTEKWFSEGGIDYETAIMDYLSFLCRRHSDPTLKPTPLVWCIWHSHILRSMSYSTTCKMLFGKVVDHDLFVDMPKETSESFEKEADVEGATSFCSFCLHLARTLLWHVRLDDLLQRI